LIIIEHAVRCVQESDADPFFGRDEFMAEVRLLLASAAGEQLPVVVAAL
jgi:hypothetical protein